MRRLSIHWNCKFCNRWIRPKIEHDCRSQMAKYPDRPKRTADRIIESPMKITKMPSEVDPPGTLLTDLDELRGWRLMQNDFKHAVLLSHCRAWLHWLDENFEEIKRVIK